MKMPGQPKNGAAMDGAAAYINVDADAYDDANADAYDNADANARARAISNRPAKKIKSLPACSIAGDENANPNKQTGNDVLDIDTSSDFIALELPVKLSDDEVTARRAAFKELQSHELASHSYDTNATKIIFDYDAFVESERCTFQMLPPSHPDAQSRFLRNMIAPRHFACSFNGAVVVRTGVNGNALYRECKEINKELGLQIGFSVNQHCYALNGITGKFVNVHYFRMRHSIANCYY